jgi:hypothetical protein
MGNSPVFIVGPSRSGTTLLQEVLNRHSRLHISAETHWFDDARSQRREPIESNSDRTLAQDWFLSLSYKPFGYNGSVERGWLQRETLELEAQATSARHERDAYFIAACKLDAARNHKPRWGEKTPRHVFRIDELLEAFPNAKIICCIRSAPAVVASYRQWGLRAGHDLASESNSAATKAEKRRTRVSYHPAIAAMLWRGAIRHSRKARARHGDDRIKLVWYEHLVENAAETVSDLTAWLDEPYESQMLDVPMVNSSFDQFRSEAGLVAQPLDRWKQKLTISEKAVVQLFCGREMKQMGYEPVTSRACLWQAIRPLLQLPVAVVRAANANRDRTGGLLPYVWRRLVST